MASTLKGWAPLSALLAATVFGVPAASHAGTAMVTGGLTSQPIGHYEFCRSNPQECSGRPHDSGPEVTSGAFWKNVHSVNEHVNRTVAPMSDRDIYGKDEVWAFPTINVGDCEDYVLDKRKRLHESGLSLANLLITVVRKPDGEGHAVLTVRTRDGDFILDNLTDAVKAWEDTGYRYLKRQASFHTGRWVTVREDQPMLVGSVK